MYRPEYERIKKETLEAKNKKADESETGELAGGGILNKDSLIEFDDGIYKDSDSEEGDDPLEEDAASQSKRTIKTIPEEDEEGKEPC